MLSCWYGFGWSISIWVSIVIWIVCTIYWCEIVIRARWTRCACARITATAPTPTKSVATKSGSTNSRVSLNLPFYFRIFDREFRGFAIDMVTLRAAYSTNTPKQAAIYAEFNWNAVEFMFCTRFNVQSWRLVRTRASTSRGPSTSLHLCGISARARLVFSVCGILPLLCAVSCVLLLFNSNLCTSFLRL